MTVNLPQKLISTLRSIAGAPVQRPSVIRVVCGDPKQAGRKSETKPGLAERDIRRALWRYTVDPEMRGSRRVPMQAIADLAGVDVQVVSAIRRGDRSKFGPDALAMVGNVIARIENGEVRFHRRRQQWEVEYPAPPDPLPPPQDKLTRAIDWREFSCCRTCGGNRFEAIEIHGAAWRACANCLPRSQWPAIGGRPIGTIGRRSAPRSPRILSIP